MNSGIASSNQTAPLPPAVVLGLSPTGLHVVRELGRAGVPVYGLSDSPQAGRYSRYLREVFIDTDPSRRLEWLCTRFAAEGMADGRRSVLIPTSDQDIDFVMAHVERLSRLFAFQRSYADGTAARIMTKESFYKLCQEHEVAYPKLWSALPQDLVNLKNRIAYPCMIKPSRIQDVKERMAGRKGWIARDATEFDRILPTIPAQAGVLLVQEIVPGPESAITLYCCYLGTDGTIYQPFTARKLRQYPPGFGSASLVQSCDEPESRDIAEVFLRRLNYCGIAAAEFKRDPATGALKIIEINVRPSLWFSISSAAGKPTVLAAYCDLAGISPPVEDIPQRQGVRWRYEPKDLWSALYYRLVSTFPLPAPDTGAVGPAQAKVFAVFAWDDPRPVLAEVMHILSKLVRRLKGW